MATPIKTGTTYLRDLVERILSTFVQAFLGGLVAGNWFDVAHIRDLSVVETAGVAGLIAVLSLIKGLVAKFVADRDSASLAPGV